MNLSDDGPLRIATLDPGERTQLAELVRALPGDEDARVDDERWIAAVRDAWEDAPAGLRRALREFRRHSGQAGTLLVRGLPVADDVGDTPSVAGSVERKATVSASVLMLIAHGLGDPGAYRPEKTGALVQNVVPVPGQENLQANSGSVHLTHHIENAFHPHRPDFVMLLCVRPDHEGIAELRTCCTRQVIPKLSEEAKTNLLTPQFRTDPPPSFSDLQSGNHDATSHAVLTGDPDDPNLCYDEAATTPLTEAGVEATKELNDLFQSSFNAIRMRAGELAIVDNHVTVHGRSAFTPRYDGRDRWLQRTYVLANLRDSRGHRPGDGYVMGT